jgi:flagellar basal body-associated protein FliL
MTLLNLTVAVLLAQDRTETGKTNQTSWVPLVIALIVLAAVAVAVFVRRSRRANNEPPAGSVPASEVPDHLGSGRMSTPPSEARRQP